MKTGPSTLVNSNESKSFLCDFEIQTGHLVRTRRPDLQ